MCYVLCSASSSLTVLLLLDCLLMLVYKDKSERAKGHKERSSMTLEDICGLDPGLSYEGLNHTLAIICLSQVVMLGFENKETMYAWDVRIRYSLGEVHRFQVFVAPGTKLESGPATLHFCNDILVLVKDLPPSVMGQWKLSDLRRYGAVPNGFIFEGGTRCGFWAGVFFLSCAEGEQISFLFDCIVRGISPTKGPFGLRPVLPDPSTNPAYSEERLAHEASQLEKRLSLLSHTSRQGSGGDDRSLSSSSSDTSHSDVSVGSRLTIWPEQSSASTSQESHGLAAAKGIHLGEEKTLPEGARGITKPPPKPLRSRQLQEIGRQSSSDSGIATGSHSSYSGSFSSYAGSLDICHGDEFGSLLSLPLNFPSDQNLCTCPHSEPQRGAGSEYQVPSSLRHIYDIPRSASDPKLQDRGRPSSLLAESSKDSSDETYVDFVSRWSDTKPQGQVSDSKSSELSPPSGASADPYDTCSPHLGMTRALFSACPICGGLKVNT
uniref:Docking protein 7 n=1 Tax=Strix occidentalis caurina TaxID=311401 RepID=A0A8D0EPR9_STROC